MISLPHSQGELIRKVRGKRSQVDFARELGCDRSCLSRYENESLGAPTTVINYCLKAVSLEMQQQLGMGWPIDAVLRHAREVVAALERLQSSIPADKHRGNSND